MSLAEILAAIAAGVPDGAAIAAKLAGTSDPARVVGVLSDAPRERVINAIFDGVVVVTEAGVFLREQSAMPSASELAAAAATKPNPLGTWVGSDDTQGWLVPRPATSIVANNTPIHAGDPFVSCLCTLDDVYEVSGEKAVVAALQTELSELTTDDARAVALVMVSYVEGYASFDDESARTNGVLVPGDVFSAGVESGTFRIGRARALGLTTIAKLRAQPIANLRSAEDRLLARMGVIGQPVTDEQYVRLSEQARAASVVFGLRNEENDGPITGWVIVATDVPVDAQTFGYHAVKELAADAYVWATALCLPIGCSFTAINNRTLVCSAPDGTKHTVTS